MPVSTHCAGGLSNREIAAMIQNSLADISGMYCPRTATTSTAKLLGKKPLHSLLASIPLEFDEIPPDLILPDIAKRGLKPSSLPIRTAASLCQSYPSTFARSKLVDGYCSVTHPKLTQLFLRAATSLEQRASK